jgi:ATP-dependent Zn protease
MEDMFSSLKSTSLENQAKDLVSSIGLDRITKSSLGTHDSQEAYKLAERYLLEIGMDETNFLISGNRDLVSKKFLKEIEAEKENLINEAFEYTKKFVLENMNDINLVKDELSKKEILTGIEIRSLLNSLSQ